MFSKFLIDDRNELQDPEEDSADLLIKEDPYLDIEIIPYSYQRFLQWNALDD